MYSLLCNQLYSSKTPEKQVEVCVRSDDRVFYKHALQSKHLKRQEKVF